MTSACGQVSVGERVQDKTDHCATIGSGRRVQELMSAVTGERQSEVAVETSTQECKLYYNMHIYIRC